MSQSILLVEDSKEVYQLVRIALNEPSLNLEWAPDISTAKKFLSKSQYDLILLDIELPDGNGIEFCTNIQSENPEVPIFLLTSHQDLSDKVLGFSAGAEDYITKPFNSLELKARVEAKLKKNEIIKKSNDRLIWKEVKINKASQLVEVLSGKNYEAVDLTALEFKILMYFATHPEEVIDRDTMLNEIWGEDIHVYSRSVDTHVSKLRKKLMDVSSIIESVHGTGYKFSPSQI